MTELYEVSAAAGLEAVRRSLGQWRGKRVALVLPEGWLELDNVARMRLLQRQAVVQQVEFALVTRNPATIDAAKTVGVPVFPNPEQAAGDRWHMNLDLPPVDVRHPERSLPDPPPWRRQDELQRIARPTHHHARQKRIRKGTNYMRPTPAWARWVGTVLLGAMIIALLGAFTYFVLPAATITVRPGRVPMQIDVTMTAVAGLEAPNVADKELPARVVRADLAAEGGVPTSGTTQKPTERALGEVVFSNLGSAPVNIPTGTSVSTSTGTPVEFRTTRDALLESGVGTRVSVPVEAVEVGIAGNVRANTINTVNGPLRFRVRVNNASGTFGGGSALVPVVTQADRDQLVAVLQQQAEGEAYATLTGQLEPGEWLPPESVQTFVVATSYDQYNDEEALELKGTVRMLAQGLAVTEADANDIILTAIEGEVPEKARLIADSVRVQRQPGSESSASSVVFTMTVGADYTTPIDADEVSAVVAGLSLEEAIRILQERWLLTGAPEIYLDPAWQSTLPLIGSRIQVRVEYGQ
ncbi:MAG: baseplate J/gp47 family protein [Caldilineaceae bacterium]|nr:baseplate J/gp47 family protein [Caldilineaceae bacterium]